jgi:hypothetical protein
MGQQWQDTARRPELVKGKLLKLLSAFHLRDHQPPCTISRRVRQATEFLLGHLLSQARLCEFTLEEGDIPDKTLSIFMRRR